MKGRKERFVLPFLTTQRHVRTSWGGKIWPGIIPTLETYIKYMQQIKQLSLLLGECWCFCDGISFMLNSI